MPKAKRGFTTQRTSAPAIPAHREVTDLRALTEFDKLPPNHQTFFIRDDASDPHLKQSEYAVVDTTDTELLHGELYVIQGSSGARRRNVVQLTTTLCQITERGPEQPVWWTKDLRGFRNTGTSALDGIPLYAGLSDGPYDGANLRSRLIGRVVGYAKSPLGNQLEAAAGWLDEDKGNAAFNPAEYVDALLAAGYRPCVDVDPAGRETYYEMFPERQKAKARDAVFLVRTKWGRASMALTLVTDECIRRGLVHDRRTEAQR